MKNLGLLALLLTPVMTGCSIDTESSEPSSGYYNPSSSSVSASDTQHSANVPTASMYVSMSAQSDGTTTKIYASVFDSETSESITLDTGDFFTASVPGMGDPIVLVLEPASDPAIVHYAGSLPASAAAQDVTIGFVRETGNVSAPSTIIHVPAPFAVSSAASSVSYGNDLSIRATPAPQDDIELEATGSCLLDSYDGDDDYNPNTFDDAVTFDANGNATLSTELLELGGTSSSSGCDVSFYFSAIHDGVIDPAFGGGISGTHDVEGSFKTKLDETLTQN